MHSYVNTGADVNLMSQDMYIKLYNDGKLKHLKPSDMKLGVWKMIKLHYLPNATSTWCTQTQRNQWK